MLGRRWTVVQVISGPDLDSRAGFDKKKLLFDQDICKGTQKACPEAAHDSQPLLILVPVRNWT